MNLANNRQIITFLSLAVISIFFLSTNFWIIGTGILIISALVIVIDLLKKIKWRNEYSTINDLKTNNIEYEQNGDIGLVVSRGNIYDIFSQDIDRIIDSW